MNARPWRVIQLDITRPGDETQVVERSTELANLSHEGWTCAASWLTSRSDTTKPHETQQQLINFVMIPPRVLEQAEREALAALISQAREEGPKTRDALAEVGNYGARELAAFRRQLVTLLWVNAAAWVAIGALIAWAAR